MKDPYDVCDYIFEKIENVRTDVRFFFPTGDHSKFDPFPSWKNEDYRGLITRISGKFLSGLHPSYFASGKESAIREELSRLKTIMNREITTSRFHYIRLFFPSSYSSLAKAGITEDYSMGYHDEPGFRAGIARPFLFYDVAEDKPTNLKIVPYQFMDVTLFQYKNMDSMASGEIIFRLVDETRKAGGLFVSIWHNTTLLDTPECKPWRELFEALLQYQKS
jgi:hypothetical protein